MLPWEPNKMAIGPKHINWVDQTKWLLVMKRTNWVDNHQMIMTAKYGSHHFTGYGENAV